METRGRGFRRARSGARRAGVYNSCTSCACIASESPSALGVFCPLSVLCPSIRELQPQEPAPPPRFRVLAKPHLLLQEDAAQSYFRKRAGRTQRPRRGGVSEEGVRGRGHEGAIVTRSERSRGLVGQAQGGAGACRAGRCWEGRRGVYVISPWG